MLFDEHGVFHCIHTADAGAVVSLKGGITRSDALHKDHTLRRLAVGKSAQFAFGRTSCVNHSLELKACYDIRVPQVAELGLVPGIEEGVSGGDNY